MQDFFALPRHELEGLCERLELPLIHAKTLFRAVYKEGLKALSAPPSLPQRLRQTLEDGYACNEASIAKESCSRYDGTVKFLIRLSDGSLVESVLMPEKKRITLCISSQVGCAQACTFCYTGRMGLKRQMSAGEIVAQVWLASQWIAQHPEWLAERDFPSFTKLSNIVFMGMGEPLDNVQEVSRALHILSDPWGLNLALRKISVSTAGHLEGMAVLLKEFPDLSLALSLHATTERERSQLMPINRRWPIGEVLSFLRAHYETRAKDRSLLIQYTVIRGVNDGERHARELIELLVGLPVKVNLIPLNEVEPSRFQGPEPGSLEAFRDRLHEAGLRVMVRYSKGQDIEAACGQLVIKNTPSSDRADRALPS